jgi:hypothetical protein
VLRAKRARLRQRIMPEPKLQGKAILWAVDTNTQWWFLSFQPLQQEVSSAQHFFKEIPIV